MYSINKYKDMVSKRPASLRLRDDENYGVLKLTTTIDNDTVNDYIKANSSYGFVSSDIDIVSSAVEHDFNVIGKALSDNTYVTSVPSDGYYLYEKNMDSSANDIVLMKAEFLLYLELERKQERETEVELERETKKRRELPDKIKAIAKEYDTLYCDDEPEMDY
jgi:hypothetical protein